LETWRLVETWDAPPGFNMALDEALFRLGGATPVLRFYTWRPDALSLGYFQRHDEVLAALAGSRPLPVIVRRATGGGAIHHARELTFSIAAPADHPLYRGEVTASYRRVHGLLAGALLELGVRAGLRGDAALASDAGTSPMCFHRSTALDLAWDGRKGIGSAQRRSAGRVLHHGSIKIGSTPLEGPIATLGAPGTRDEPAPSELAARVRRAFERGLDARFEVTPPTAAELAHAEARAHRFLDPAFVRRR